MVSRGSHDLLVMPRDPLPKFPFAEHDVGMSITASRYTVADLEDFPDDGNRYELLDGFVLVTPWPNLRHQSVSARLLVQLYAGMGTPPPAHVVGPGALYISDTTYFEPDLFVFPSRFSPDSKWTEVDERWLVAEIYSASSRFYDRELKRDAYLAAGVSDLWLIDPREKSVEVCRRGARAVIATDTIRWRPPGLEMIVPVNVAELFAG
jgi:Uma2 family endonuclease